MDERQHSSGNGVTLRYRTKITVACPTHAEGHHVKMYSRGTDDAWWLSEVFARFTAQRGYACKVSFEQSTDGKAWEVVPPFLAVPDEPVF